MGLPRGSVRLRSRVGLRPAQDAVACAHLQPNLAQLLHSERLEVLAGFDAVLLEPVGQGQVGPLKKKATGVNL